MSSEQNESLERASLVNVKRVLVNAGSNYGYYLLQAVILLFLQAYVVRSVGKAEYSLWPICRSCMSFSGLIQIGIGVGTGRFLAFAIGKKDIEEIHRITSTMFFAFCIGGAIYLSVFTWLAVNFEKIFEIPDGAQGIGAITMILLGIAGAITMPFSVFEGSLNAAQERVRVNLIRSTMLVLRLIVVICLFELGSPSIVWIALTQLILSIAESLALFKVAGLVFPWRRISLRDFNWSTLKTVNSFSLLTLVSAVFGKMYWDADNIIINRLIDPSLVAGYAIVVTLSLKSYDLARLTTTAITAPLTVLYARGDTKKIEQTVYRCNKIAVPFGSISLVYFALNGAMFLEWYVGGDFKEFGILFSILCPAFILSQTQSLNSKIPGIFGRALIPAICSSLAAIANLVISLVLVYYCELGIKGVAIGTVSIIFVYRVAFWTVYSSILLKVPFLRFFGNVVLFPLLHCLPSTAILVFVAYIGIAPNFAASLFFLALAFVVQAVFSYSFGLQNPDRVKVKLGMARIVRLLILEN
jgi:O-antigen/teichoic acid export membrane protein